MQVKAVMSFNAAAKRKNDDDPYHNKENVFMKSAATEGDLSPAIGCLQLKMRHSSSDSPHHQSSAATALSRLFSLFRSRSDSSVKSGLKSDATNKSSSAKSHSKLKTRSASQSPTDKAPRRRFVRVVRDSEAQAPEKLDDNPHVICRYSQQFLEEHYRKSQDPSSNKPLPYIASGNTILKKSSTDPTPSYDQHSPAVEKHATFKELVEIIEFSGHDMLENGTHVSREERLHDDELESDDRRAPGFFLRPDSFGDSDLDCELDAGSSQPEDDEVEEEVASKVPAVDLNRMDGIMKNIFSSVANVHESHSSPEPAKLRRVELSELVHQFNTDEQQEIDKTDAKS